MQAERDYIEFAGVGPEFWVPGRLLSQTAARTKCARLRGRCAGLVLVEEGAGLLPELDLARLLVRPATTTLVKLELPYTGAGVGLAAPDSYAGLDRCCPSPLPDGVEVAARLARGAPAPALTDCNRDPQLFRQEVRGGARCSDWRLV